MSYGQSLILPFKVVCPVSQTLENRLQCVWGRLKAPFIWVNLPVIEENSIDNLDTLKNFQFL